MFLTWEREIFNNDDACGGQGLSHLLLLLFIFFHLTSAKELGINYQVANSWKEGERERESFSSHVVEILSALLLLAVCPKREKRKASLFSQVINHEIERRRKRESKRPKGQMGHGYNSERKVKERGNIV